LVTVGGILFVYAFDVNDLYITIYVERNIAVVRIDW